MAADRAGGLETVLRFMRSQPHGFKCTRDDIVVGTGMKLQTVCGRVADALDIEKHNPPLLAEDGSVRDGKKLVSLNNGEGLQQAQRSSVATQERLQIEPDACSGLRSESAGRLENSLELSVAVTLKPAPVVPQSVNDEHSGRLNRSLSARTTGKGCPGERLATSVAPALQSFPTSSASSSNTFRHPSAVTPPSANDTRELDGAFSTPESTAPAPAAFSNHGQAESVTVAGAVDTGSESHRHACEVRAVANMPDREYRKHYLAGVRRKRGDAAVERIKNDLKAMVGA